MHAPFPLLRRFALGLILPVGLFSVLTWGQEAPPAPAPEPAKATAPAEPKKEAEATKKETAPEPAAKNNADSPKGESDAAKKTAEAPKPEPTPKKKTEVKPPSDPSQQGDFTGKVVIIPVGREDLINPARFEFMSRTLKRATSEGAEAVIFNLDTPGGLAWETATFIMEDLQKLKCPSFSFVNPRAISAGALIAIGTDAIYMAPRSSIGAATPVSSTGMEMGEAERAKNNSAFMAMARSAAVAKGHNAAVVDAMIDKDLGLKIGNEEIRPKGVLVTLDQKEATKVYDGKPLLAKAIVENLDEIKDREALKGESITAQPKGFELVAIWITQYAAILLLIGIAAGYIEMQHPGFGVPGAIAAIAFFLFFFGHYVAGSLVGYETVFIFVLGVILIIVELFVIPGTLVPGLLGLLCIFGALIYTMAGWDINIPEGGKFPVRFADYVTALRNLGIAFVGAIAIILLFMRYFPTTGPFKFLVLRSEVGGQQAAIEGEGQRKASSVSVGDSGVTRSAMRPYGHVDFGGTQLEAMVEGDYLTPGSNVRVRSVQGGKIVVERA
jgi:membrane-bound serine protease (ClpP class)